MNEKLYRLTVLLCNVVGAAATGFGGMYGFARGYLGPALVLLGVAALAIPPAVAFAVTVKKSGLEIRDSALKALTELCHVFLNLSDECEARVTLLRVDTAKEPARLRALARGGRDGKLSKSSMSIHQGVAGLCYRSRKVAQKPAIDDFAATMRDLGFTDQEIKEFQSDRKAYLCFPVLVDGAVVAVISCDSKLPNVFGEPQEKVVEKLSPFFARLLSIEETAKE